MKTVGAFEGKTHFSALIDAAERGEETLITRNGKPVAKIVPVDEPQTWLEAIHRFQAKKLTLGMPIKEAIERGRRY